MKANTKEKELVDALERLLPAYALKDYRIVRRRSDWRFHVFTWVLACLSLLGVWLNIYKLETCFYIWAVTNALWAVVDWKRGIYAQSVLHMVYFGSAIWGILTW